MLLAPWYPATGEFGAVGAPRALQCPGAAAPRPRVSAWGAGVHAQWPGGGRAEALGAVGAALPARRVWAASESKFVRVPVSARGGRTASRNSPGECPCACLGVAVSSPARGALPDSGRPLPRAPGPSLPASASRSVSHPPGKGSCGPEGRPGYLEAPDCRARCRSEIGTQPCIVRRAGTPGLPGECSLETSSARKAGHGVSLGALHPAPRRTKRTADGHLQGPMQDVFAFAGTVSNDSPCSKTRR